MRWVCADAASDPRCGAPSRRRSSGSRFHPGVTHPARGASLTEARNFHAMERPLLPNWKPHLTATLIAEIKNSVATLRPRDQLPAVRLFNPARPLSESLSALEWRRRARPRGRTTRPHPACRHGLLISAIADFRPGR